MASFNNLTIVYFKIAVGGVLPAAVFLMFYGIRRVKHKSDKHKIITSCDDVFEKQPVRTIGVGI